MTSEERHEARYQRRVKKRQERRLALSKSCGDFEDVFSYENLYQSGHKAGVVPSWDGSGLLLFAVELQRKVRRIPAVLRAPFSYQTR